MKIDPSKDYKKPLYAIGLAAAIAASSLALTGCENPVSTFFENSRTAGLMAIDLPESPDDFKRYTDATSVFDIPAGDADEAEETT